MSRAAGEMNRKILIEANTGALDGTNQRVDAWTTFKQKWARPLGLTGLASIRASDPSLPLPPGRYSWRVNYDTSVTVAHRVNYKGMVFDIRDVRHDLSRREYTDLVCEYGGNNG